MIAGLESYAAMKDSGTPWLGMVPSHWNVLPNRAVFSEVKTRNSGDEQMLSVTIKRGVIEQRQLLSDSSKKDGSRLDKSAYKLVCPGDVAYNKMRAWQGAVGVSELRGIVSPAYVVMRPAGNVIPRYFHYLLRTPAFAKEAERWSYGITSDMWSLRPEHFKLIYSCVPTEQEQAAIVRFLDHADRRIRRAIAAKQKLIKLLEEQKQAIIHCVITRGLDPNVRLKPSGVDWLGDVPEHWETRRVSSCLLSSKAGIWGDDPTQANQSDHIICVRVADFDMDNLCVGDMKLTIRAVPVAAREPRLLAAGDILLEKSGGGEAEPVGRVVRFGLSEPSICSNFITRLRPDGLVIDPEFLLHVLASMQSMRRNIPWIKQTTGIQNLNERGYLSLPIAVPPMAEQASVVAELARLVGSVRRTSERVGLEIKLLREYRTRLIADVVTGKLDVRKAAARLPNEVEVVGSDPDEGLTEDGDDINEEGEAADSEDMAA